jgi:hypothetical protein
MNKKKEKDKDKDKSNLSIHDYISEKSYKFIKKKAEEKVKTYIEDVLTERPQNVSNLLNRFGNNNIIEITVCRKPIEGLTKKLLNIATFGQLESKLKKFNYDDIFHLYMNIKLDNQLTFGFEKNQTVDIKRGGFPFNNIYKDEDGEQKLLQECKVISDVKDIKLLTFFEKGEKKGGKNFYRYSEVDNCQKFVNDLLVANGIKYLSSFIMQKIDEIIKDKDIINFGRKLVDAFSLYARFTQPEQTFKEDKKSKDKDLNLNPDTNLIGDNQLNKLKDNTPLYYVNYNKYYDKK